MFSPTSINQNLGIYAASNLPLPRSAEPVSREEVLVINVVFTNIHATLAALNQAGQLAHQLQARIRILVPQVVPYSLPLERPQLDPSFKVRPLWTLCSQGAIESRIDVLLCRDPWECIRNALSGESMVVIAGRKRWWRTREKRLARHLQHWGHTVIFVPEN